MEWWFWIKKNSEFLEKVIKLASEAISKKYFTFLVLFSTQTSHTQKSHEAPKVGQKLNKKIA